MSFSTRSICDKRMNDHRLRVLVGYASTGDWLLTGEPLGVGADVGMLLEVCPEHLMQRQ